MIRRIFPIAALVGLAVAMPAVAGDAEPKHQDTRETLKPREVTLSAVIEPAEAEPGSTVTYKVTARIEDGWHVYAYKPEQSDEGPRATQFDLFDPDGLEVGESWEPEEAPTSEPEPAFPNLDTVEFHEETVTWSIPLTVPADAKSGTASVRSQIYFQICNDESCKPPSYCTVPAAEVRIVPPGATASLFRLARFQEPAGPKHKDSKDFLKPTEVKFTTAIEPAQAKPGETVSYQITADVQEPWHIYAHLEEPPATGPKFTEFDLFNPADLEPAGAWTASPEPTSEKEPAFPELESVEFHEGKVTWSIPLTVPADAEPGSRSIGAQIYFQICKETTCYPPAYWTVPGSSMEVVDPTAETVEAPATAPKVEKSDGEASPTPKSADPAGPAESKAPGSSKVERSTRPATAGNDVQGAIGEGFFSFLLASALGGLLAILMPCVWPMIPITANFFVKQGEKKGGSGLGLALTYCAAIIGTFTVIGLVVSAIMGETGANKLGNNPWLNAFFAVAFIAFGLSLLGLFEIRLPSALLNASARGEGKGGLVGVIFMATTLTITSFTCTAPVVGSLLVYAARGEYFYPVVGLMVFSAVLSLPFFVLAMLPGLLKKVPKSGDWMNAVKVVGGLLEIGAAFKFLNLAEVNFRGANRAADAFFDAPLVLSIWVVLVFVCGIYLLGLFRTDHDQEAPKVGPGRMVSGVGFLSLAIYLAPALFGSPPTGSLYSYFMALLPPDAHEKLNGDDRIVSEVIARLGQKLDTLQTGPMTAIAEIDPNAPASERPRPLGTAKNATSTDPTKAVREERTFHGVAWILSYDEALETAKAENRPVLVDFTGVNCVNCRLMEQNVMPRSEVVEQLRKFVTVQVYTDTVPIRTLTKLQAESMAEDNLEFESELIGQVTSPQYAIVGPDGTVLAQTSYNADPADFVDFLKRGLDEFDGQADEAVASR